MNPRWLAAVITLAFVTSGLAAQPQQEPAGLDVVVSDVLQALRGPASDPGSRVAATLRAMAFAEGIHVAPQGPCPTMDAAIAQHAGRLGVPAPDAVRLDPSVSDAIGCLLGAVHDANQAMDSTFDGIPAEKVLQLYQSEDDPAPELLALITERDHAANLAAAIHVADAVSRTLPILRASSAALALTPVDLEPILFLDASDDTRHTNNYAVSIDLAGNDIYDNHAGGIFLAAGSGIYEVESGSPWREQNVLGQNVAVGGGTQDADFAFSAGLAIDLEGDDQWGVKRGPILTDLDHGCGTEDRVPFVDTIGGGILGVGMAFDLAGDNEYYGRTQTQGAGHVFGVGVLYTGPGRDDHEAVRGAMGSGLLGGIGLLVDEGGDSTYTFTSPVGGVFNGDRHFCDDDPRYGMGGNFDRKDGPFTPQIGVLADLGGNDSYNAVHSAQGFSQGSGFGLLLDVAGNDAYQARNIAQGAGHGRAIPFEPEAIWSGGAAFLLDLAGDDDFAAASEAQGWALGDTMAAPIPPTDDLDALLQWAVKREDAIGVLLDARGNDTYSGPSGRANGARLTDGTLGVFADTS